MLFRSDGNGTLATPNYQWERNTGTHSQPTWTTIASATTNTYVVTASDVGHEVHLKLSYTDGAGNADSILGDPRVQATLNSRMSGLFGRPVRHRAANTSRAAKEVLDAVGTRIELNLMGIASSREKSLALQRLGARVFDTVRPALAEALQDAGHI